MLPLCDPQLRLGLLQHLAVRLREDDTQALRALGIEPAQLARLRALPAPELSRLASMRGLTIGVALDAGGLKAGLRAVALAGEAKALETYFIRHGASWRMMKALFKLSHRRTLDRRRELGVRRSGGRFRLPDARTVESICRVWYALREADLRLRYRRLHQAFPEWSLAALAAVVEAYEPR